MNRERDAHESFPANLPAMSGRRLSSQIGRAFRGTFGAEIGLRTLMRSVAAKMLAEGVTEQSVRRTFELCVMHHPARMGRDSHSLMSGKSHSAALVEIANECVAAAARGEPDGPDAPSSGTATQPWRRAVPIPRV